MERFKAGEVRAILEILQQAEEELERRVLQVADRLSRSRRAIHSQALQEALDRIRDIREEVWRRVDARVYEGQQAVIPLATSVAYQALQATIPLVMDFGFPTMAAVLAATRASPLDGRLLSEWVEGMQTSEAQALWRTIRRGFVLGDSTPVITAAVMREARKSWRWAEAVTRTALHEAAMRGQEAIWAANRDIIVGIEMVATLDGRTTLFCINIDGQVFPVDKGPRPPFHIRCRTVPIPRLDGVELTVGRPFVRDTRTPAGRELDFRAQAQEQAGLRWGRMRSGQRAAAVQQVKQEWIRENIGHEITRKPYPEWFAQQPEWFQMDKLGPTRGALYRKGGLTLKQFQDSSGREYTIEELRQSVPEAFRAAGLSG